MRKAKQPTVYMMANGLRGTIYAGVTSDLVRRDYEHNHGITDGFTKKHHCSRLVWYELHETMEHAILLGKSLKAARAKRKSHLSRKKIHSGMICHLPYNDDFSSLRGAPRRSNPSAFLRGQDGLLRLSEAVTILKGAQKNETRENR